MSKIFVTTALVASFTAGVAFAGGYVAPIVAVEPVVAVAAAPTTWAGGYVGGNLSYGKGKLKGQGTVGDAVDFAEDELDADLGALREALGAEGLATSLARTLLKPDGASGAVRAGYDWQSGAMVYGLGAEYNLGKYKDSLSGVLDLDEEVDASVGVEVKNMATIFARAGYAFNDQVMAYGLIGYSRAKGKATVGLGELSESASVTLSGVTYGLGAEYKFNQNWSSYAEYTHTDFGKVKDTGGLLKAEVDQFKLGVNYRF